MICGARQNLASNAPGELKNSRSLNGAIMAILCWKNYPVSKAFESQRKELRHRVAVSRSSGTITVQLLKQPTGQCTHRTVQVARCRRHMSDRPASRKVLRASSPYL